MIQLHALRDRVGRYKSQILAQYAIFFANDVSLSIDCDSTNLLLLLLLRIRQRTEMLKRGWPEEWCRHCPYDEYWPFWSAISRETITSTVLLCVSTTWTQSKIYKKRSFFLENRFVWIEKSIATRVNVFRDRRKISPRWLFIRLRSQWRACVVPEIVAWRRCSSRWCAPIWSRIELPPVMIVSLTDYRASRWRRRVNRYRWPAGTSSPPFNVMGHIFFFAPIANTWSFSNASRCQCKTLPSANLDPKRFSTLFAPFSTTLSI